MIQPDDIGFSAGFDSGFGLAVYTRLGLNATPSLVYGDLSGKTPNEVSEPEPEQGGGDDGPKKARPPYIHEVHKQQKIAKQAKRKQQKKDKKPEKSYTFDIKTYQPDETEREIAKLFKVLEKERVKKEAKAFNDEVEALLLYVMYL